MAYDPRPVEPVLYTRWLDAGVFQPRPQGDPYVIVIPPPNVTAELHVGHALNNVVQDVLSASSECAAGPPSGCLERIMRASRPKMSSKNSSRPRARHASTWDARHSWREYGSSCAVPATQFSSNSRLSAAPATGAAPGLRSLLPTPMPYARSSCGSGTRD